MINSFSSCMRNSKAKNKSIFSVSLLCFLLFTGCTYFVTKPIPPSPPYSASTKIQIPTETFPKVEENIQLTDVNWPHPDKIIAHKYEAEKGSKNPVTIDGVTVEVVSLTGERNKSLIECSSPDNKPISYSVIPMAARVKITNNTDHVVSLGQTAMLTGTVITLENDKGEVYPLYENKYFDSREGEWRKDASVPITTYYNKCS